MRRLSSLGSRQLAHRKGRSALTALGIVLGVAILFGVLVSNATTQRGIDTLIEDFTGKADVLVIPTGAFGATMPETDVQKLEALPAVEAAVGSYRMRSAVRAANGEFTRIDVLGIDLRTAARVQPYPLLSGSLFQPREREAIAPARLLDKIGARVGSDVQVDSPHGKTALRVVGVLQNTGAGRTNQGDVMFTSMETARALARVGRVYTGARLVLAGGTDAERWIAQHENALGPRYEFEDAGTFAAGFKTFIGILGGMFTFFAAISLFVGAFLIYLTLSMAVIERTRMYGTMRALGATRRQIRRVVVGEALVLGAVSTIAGLLLGLLVARGLLVLLAGLFEIDLPGLAVQPGAVVAGILVGLGVTLVSALIPARRAARLSPVAAMRGDYAADTRLGRLWMLGGVCAVIGIVVGLLGGRAAALGALLVLLGAVLLVPLLLRPLARVLGRVTNRIARGVGDVAVLHLVKERSRSAYTLALIMVVMAMIFSIGGLQASIVKVFDETLDRSFGADIQIETAYTDAPTFTRALHEIPGVAAVTPLRFSRTQLVDAKKPDGQPGDDEVIARVIDPESYFAIESFPFVEGTEPAVRAALLAGRAVMVPSGTAESLGARLGDDVRLRTVSGVKRFRLVATYTALGGPPEIILSYQDAKRFLGAQPTASEYHVKIAEGADVGAVRDGIERTLGERFTLKAQTAATVKADARGSIGRFFSIFYAIVLFAALVGLLGLANTLAMSVLQRYREIGVLRAIGTTRGQVRRMVLVESATLGLVAFALSLPLGFVLSTIAVRGMSSAFGLTIPYVYPAGWVPVVAAFGILVAVVGALAPGRRAAKLEVVSALQYE